ncbi:sigma-70 family RNA polymerase sigma factor [Roseomonas sp. SSH11]|uniref:Sigma-70 family RNA polymerase sigma factor n=1 Tax=Pararoseomonas baculiformis TaxID=2820812 RepID=A0ABS4AJR9_9PROT|nr:sigma-70 family RNA polymerase sigma factor [Pararoseomonas baculiformis]MBP0447267.1 sigma-70 family RNA polymerase sigma factor [Pararoseomonas baculiformis]
MTEPLRKTRRDGTSYTRPPEIERALAAVLSLSRDEIAECLQINSNTDPRYLASECIVHLVRQTRHDDDPLYAERLFKALIRRVERTLPRPEHALLGGGQGQSARALDIQAGVVSRFVDLLCADRESYDTRLDMFEVRFNFALAKLRSTVRRTVDRQNRGHEPLSYDDETGEPSREVGEAIERYRPSLFEKLEEEDYRRRVLAVIDTLSEKERNVMMLLMKGIDIDSMDLNKPTIARMLGCTEKTVRNRRDTAVKKIAEILELSPVP